MRNLGEFYNRDKAKQLISFSGMEACGLVPTDIDGLIECRNRAYVLIEVKHVGAVLPAGQELALSRLCDDLERAGKPTLLLIAYHTEDNLDKDILLSETMVTKYRYCNAWHGLKAPKRLVEIAGSFLRKHGGL
jgi:hypothetical protein